MRDDENDVENITKDIGNIHKELDKLKGQQKNLLKMAQSVKQSQLERQIENEELIAFENSLEAANNTAPI